MLGIVLAYSEIYRILFKIMVFIALAVDLFFVGNLVFVSILGWFPLFENTGVTYTIGIWLPLAFYLTKKHWTYLRRWFFLIPIFFIFLLVLILIEGMSRGVYL